MGTMGAIVSGSPPSMDLPESYRPPPSLSLRRQTVHGSRSMGEEAVHKNNHTLSLAICASAQHGFVGPGVVRPACRHPPYKVSPAPVPPRPRPWLMSGQVLHADVPRH